MSSWQKNFTCGKSTLVNDISKQKQEDNQRRREMGRFSYHCQAFWKDDAGGYIGMVGFHVGYYIQQVIRKRRSKRAIDLFLKATRDDEDVMVNTDYKQEVATVLLNRT
jgi:hypothetical protein